MNDIRFHKYVKINGYHTISIETLFTQQIITRFLSFSITFRMRSFLEIWLCMLTLTVVGIAHQAFVGGSYTGLLFKVLGAEMCAFVGFWVYWMILYPQYFTPFRDLPTPSVCTTVGLHYIEDKLIMK